MTWVDDRLKQRHAEQQRVAAIAPYVETVYQNLWNEILARIEDAKAGGLLLFTNGTTFERIVRLTVLKGGNPEELTIKLDSQKQMISVLGLSSLVTFTMDLCKDGIVCLKHENQEVILKDAAKLILDPFFFPEFHP